MLCYVPPPQYDIVFLYQRELKAVIQVSPSCYNHPVKVQVIPQGVTHSNALFSLVL